MVQVFYSEQEKVLQVAMKEGNKVMFYDIPKNTDLYLLVAFLVESYAIDERCAEIPDELKESFKWLCEQKRDVRVSQEDLEDIDASNVKQMAEWLKAFIISSVVKRIM